MIKSGTVSRSTGNPTLAVSKSWHFDIFNCHVSLSSFPPQQWAQWFAALCFTRTGSLTGLSACEKSLKHDDERLMTKHVLLKIMPIITLHQCVSGHSDTLSFLESSHVISGEKSSISIRSKLCEKTERFLSKNKSITTVTSYLYIFIAMQLLPL